MKSFQIHFLNEFITCCALMVFCKTSFFCLDVILQSQSNVLNMKYNHEEFIQQISIIHGPGHGVKLALPQ